MGYATSMKKFTLDTNCIIDLEEGRGNSRYLQKLIQAWNDGQIELAVVAVSASENLKDCSLDRTYSVFEQKLERAGLAGISQLQPLMKWDVFFWDHALWSDDAMEKLESEIRRILFPNIVSIPPLEIASNSKWRNELCDVLVAWSHAYHRYDYLVTRDDNFHKHKDELKRIGIDYVLSPEEAANLC